MTGDDMKALRLALGMTRKRLGHELGVSEQMIYQYEIGSRTLPRRRILQMARLADREQVSLEDSAPCPTCHGTGWVAGPAPPQGALYPPDPDRAPLRLARFDDDDDDDDERSNTP